MKETNWDEVALILEAIRESNNIEDEWDDDSLMQAFYAWQFLVEQKELTVGVVLKTHKILMLHQKLRPNERGYFRTVPVWVGNREGRPHYVVPELIENWVKKANLSRTEDAIKEDHIVYEEIHPFVDGNGRTGRLFLNWQRVNAGLPPLVIREAEKEEYYQWFQRKSFNFATLRSVKSKLDLGNI